MITTKQERLVGEVSNNFEILGSVIASIPKMLAIVDQGAKLSIRERIESREAEQREIVSTVIDALLLARETLDEIAQRLLDGPLEGVGLEIMFWSFYIEVRTRVFDLDILGLEYDQLNNELLLAVQAIEHLHAHFLEHLFVLSLTIH